MIISEEARRHNIEIRSQTYYWYKAHGICPYCGVRNPEPGRVHCKQCLRHIKALQERRDPGKARHKQYNHERRERLKAAGLCTDCGRAWAVDGKTRCAKCLERMADSRTKRKILRRMDMEADAARKRSVRYENEKQEKTQEN